VDIEYVYTDTIIKATKNIDAAMGMAILFFKIFHPIQNIQQASCC
jgi:hypothetical protein